MGDSPQGRPRWEEKLEQRRQRFEERMERRRRRWETMGEHRMRFHSGFGGALIGLFLAGLGVLLLLQNLGIVFVEDLWDYWPVILIAFGLVRLASAWSGFGRVGGGIVAGIGVVFLLRNLGLIHGNVWGFFWPAILIAAGVGMLLRGIDRGHGWHWDWDAERAHAASASRDASSLNAVSIDAIFSGANRRFDTQEFEGGHAGAVFGGVELDLRKAGMKADQVRLDCHAMFGGVDIRVPETWLVVMRGTGIFGGFTDETNPPPRGDAKAPVLLVTGSAMFGGVTVKN